MLVHKTPDRRIVMVGAFLGVFLILNMLFTGSTTSFGTNLRFYAIIVFSLLFAFYIDFTTFRKLFVNILVFLTAVTLIEYLLVEIMGNTALLNRLPLLTNANDVSAYNGIFFCVYTYRYDRLMSIFWEPSIYSTFANLAILFEVFFEEKLGLKTISKITILVLGIIASKSTGGVLVLFLLVFFFLITSSNNKTLKYVLVILGGIVAALVYVYQYELLGMLINVDPEVFYKLDAAEESGSYTTRMDSGPINFRIFTEHPLFGVGLGKVDGIYESYGGENETSTLTYYLAAFGIAGIIPSYLVIKAFIRQKFIFGIYKIFLIFLFFFLLLKEPYWFCSGMYVIIFILLKNQVKGARLTYNKV